MPKNLIGGVSSLKNSTSCTIGLRYLLAGLSRKEALDHIVAYCSELIEYPEQSVISPVLKLFYNKSRIVTFYANQNFKDSLSKVTADVFCLHGTFMCNGILSTLSNDNCWDFNVLLSYTALPFFSISYLFCETAREQQQNNLQRSVVRTGSFLQHLH